MKHKARYAAVSASLMGALGVGLGVAAPAVAAPVVTGGLVNVTVTNLLNNNQVAIQIPVNAAANICGVTVDAITSGTSNGNTFTCTSRSGNQQLSITGP